MRRTDHRRIQHRWSLLLCWTLVAICSTAGGVLATQPIQEDGVEVIFSEQPRWAEAEGWRLSDSPELVIGEDTDDPQYLFADIFSFVTRPRGPGYGRGPLRLPDGQIVVGEPSPSGVLLFDASGRFVRTLLGSGEGPTELSYLRELHRCSPGMLVAVDARRFLLATLDSTGKFHGRYYFERNAGRSLYMPVSCNRNGQILAMDYAGLEAEYKERMQRLQDEQFVFYRNRLHIRLLDSEGYEIRDLGEFPGVERVDYNLPTGGTGSVPHPLGKTTARALGTNRAFIGTADDFEIQAWSLDGVLRQRWQRPVADLTIREGDVAAYDSVDPTVATYLRTRWGRASSAVPMPETYPAYTRFILDASGHLWVEHFRTPHDKRHLWSVFAPDGVWLGEVEVPYTFEITDIGKDYVLGVYRDELDEQSVRMYGLSRG